MTLGFLDSYFVRRLYRHLAFGRTHHMPPTENVRVLT